MSLPQPAPRPGSASEPESDRIYAPSGRHLTGAAANARKAYDSRIASVDESVAGMRALAQTMLDVLTVDQIRNRIGRERALDLIRSASGEQAAERIGGNWSREDPGPRQLTRQLDGYEGDWRHDSRYTSIIGRVPADEERRVAQELQAEYTAAAQARERRRREREGTPNIPHGPIGSRAHLPGHVAGGNTAKGAQWDPIGHVLTVPGGQQDEDFWGQYPDHSPEFLRRQGYQAPSLGGTQLPSPPEMAAWSSPTPLPQQPCSHWGMAGKKFCGQCGQPLQVDYWRGAAGQAPIDKEDPPPAPEAPSA